MKFWYDRVKQPDKMGLSPINEETRTDDYF